MFTQVVTAFLSVIWVLNLVTGVTGQGDSCTDYIDIGNENRSTLNARDDNICDRGLLPDKWYRFEAATGSEIPELNIGEIRVQHCGTFAPIYIVKRVGESYHDEAKRQGSVSAVPICTNVGTGCDRTGTITIRYCNQRPEFFVYQLAIPTSCPIAYCAGQGCPGGSIWDGFTCINAYPPMKRPVLSNPEIYKTEEAVKCPGIIVSAFAFYCLIQYDEQPMNPRARFDVEVLFDGVVSPTPIFTTTSQELAVTIDEWYLKGNMGKEISCQVTTYFEGSTERSPPQESNRYWIGIRRLEPFVVDLCSPDDPDLYEIDVYSTVPITCWHCYDVTVTSLCQYCYQTCHYTYEMRNGAQIPAKSHCELTVTNLEYDNQPSFVAGDIEFQLTKNAQFIRNNQNFEIQFNPFTPEHLGLEPFTIWTGYQISAVPIKVTQDCVPDECSCEGDPHYITTKKTLPSVYLLGDFIVAKYIDETKQIFMEIQARHFECLPFLTCNCAVIVREGNSVLGLNACDGPVQTIRYLEQHDRSGNAIPDGSAIYVDATGYSYTILMTSGLAVRIFVSTELSKPYLNLYMTFPPNYHVLDDSSLCTWFTPPNSGEHLRLSDEESMFVNYHRPCVTWANQPAIACSCTGQDNTMACPLPPGCVAEAKVTSTGLGCLTMSIRNGLDNSTSYPVRSKNLTQYYDTMELEEAFSHEPFDPDFGSDVNLVWPTPLGKTELDAQNNCLDGLRSSPAYTKCQGKYDEAGIVAFCKLDIQLGDDYNIVQSYIHSLETSCKDWIIMNSNATTSDELVDDPVYSDVNDVLCPSQCKGRGSCEKGLCNCAQDFAGPDCGVDVTLPPSIEQLENDGFCNLTSKICSRFKVFASNIFDSENLICQYTFFELLPGRRRRSSAGVVVMKADFLTNEQLSCPVPESKLGASTGYFVSISNDGVLFSERRQFIVYDPTCLSVTDKTWIQKGNTCLLNQFCYEPDERQNVDSCLICEPQNSWKDIAAWTPMSDCSRSCDRGVIGRTYGCEGVVKVKETHYCQLSACPAKPTELNQGVIVRMNSSDAMLTLDASQQFFQTFAESVNFYCLDNRAKCCDSLEFEKISMGLRKKKKVPTATLR